MSIATGNTEDQVSVATMIALIHRSYDQKRFDGYNSDGGRHWDRDGQDGRIDRGDQGDGSNRTKSWNSDGSSRSVQAATGRKRGPKTALSGHSFNEEGFFRRTTN